METPKGPSPPLLGPPPLFPRDFKGEPLFPGFSCCPLFSALFPNFHSPTPQGPGGPALAGLFPPRGPWIFFRHGGFGFFRGGFLWGGFSRGEGFLKKIQLFFHVEGEKKGSEPKFFPLFWQPPFFPGPGWGGKRPLTPHLYPAIIIKSTFFGGTYLPKFWGGPRLGSADPPPGVGGEAPK